MLWPLVPLYWIPVHAFPKIFRKIGLFTYIVPLITWLPVAYLIYQQRSFLLQHKILFPVPVTLFGTAVFVCGALLQIWTGKLLRLSGLIGVPEVSQETKGRFVAEGPFLVVRHPTYLSHTLMFSGVFLTTGVIAVGVSAIIDLAVVNLVVIPLEEEELITRFGNEYLMYRERVPRYLPAIRSHKPRKTS